MLDICYTDKQSYGLFVYFITHILKYEVNISKRSTVFFYRYKNYNSNYVWQMPTNICSSAFFCTMINTLHIQVVLSGKHKHFKKKSKPFI